MLLLGIDFQMKTLTLGSTTIILQLWDTAGQERSDDEHGLFLWFGSFCKSCIFSFLSPMSVQVSQHHRAVLPQSWRHPRHVRHHSPPLLHRRERMDGLCQGEQVETWWFDVKTCKILCANLNTHAGDWQHSLIGISMDTNTIWVMTLCFWVIFVWCLCR